MTWMLVMTFLWLSGGSLVVSVPDPAYATKALCETARTELTLKLYTMWPDPKANVKKILVNCRPR